MLNHNHPRKGLFKRKRYVPETRSIVNHSKWAPRSGDILTMADGRQVTRGQLSAEVDAAARQHYVDLTRGGR